MFHNKWPKYIHDLGLFTPFFFSDANSENCAANSVLQHLQSVSMLTKPQKEKYDYARYFFKFMWNFKHYCAV